MHRSIRARVLARSLGLLTLAGIAPAALAANFSFKSSFSTDDQLVMFSIDLPAAGDMSALTLSYGGGVNGKSEVIAAGGFAPVLTLFDGSGNDVHGNTGASNSCPGSGSFCWDAVFTLLGAPAGHYTLVLTQDGNNPNGQLADGFSMVGQPHYTGQYIGSASATFIQIDQTQRTGQWALDLSLPGTVSPVPEPASAGLLLAGLAMAVLARRRAHGPRLAPQP